MRCCRCLCFVLARVPTKSGFAKQEIIIFMTNKLNKFITLFPLRFTVFSFNVSAEQEKKIMKLSWDCRVDCFFFSHFFRFFFCGVDLMNENRFQVDNIDISLGDIEAAALNVYFRFIYTEKNHLQASWRWQVSVRAKQIRKIIAGSCLLSQTSLQCSFEKCFIFTRLDKHILAQIDSLLTKNS